VVILAIPSKMAEFIKEVGELLEALALSASPMVVGKVEGV
jgi:hypothetical protein